MTIEVEAPDGSVVEFPDGTSDDTIKRAMAQAYPPETWAEYATGVARHAAQGLTASTADEIEALARSGGYRFTPGAGKSPFNVADWEALSGGSPYTENVERIRRENQQFAARHPVVSTAAGIGGSIVPFVGGPGAALARSAIGSTLPRTMARSAALGTGIGGVYGFGAGEGGVPERLEAARMGAAFGAGLGAAAPAAIAGVGGVARFARGVGEFTMPRTTRRLRDAMMGRGGGDDLPFSAGPRQQPVEGATFVADGTPPPPTPETLGAQDRALGLLRDQLLREGKSVADVRRELIKAARSRRFYSGSYAPDATALVDVVPGWQRLAGAAGRGYTEAGRDMAAFIRARQTGITPPTASAEELAQRGIPTRARFARAAADAPAAGQFERIREALRRTFTIKDAEFHGHRTTGTRTVEEIVNAAETAAMDDFGRAFAAFPTLNLKSTIGPVFRKFLDRASMEESTAIEAYIGRVRRLFMRKGKPIYLRQFHQIKRELDGLIKDDLAKPKYVHRGGILNDLKNELLDAVDAATGGEASLYRAARAQFSDEISAADAYVMGRRALGDDTRLRRTGPGREITSQEITADHYLALSDGEKKLFRLGMLDALTAGAARKPRAREALNVFESPKVQELLSVVIPRTETATGRVRMRGGRPAVFADRPERFGGYVDLERAMLNTRDVVLGNSMTARNLADDAMLASMEAFQNVQSLAEIFRSSGSLGTLGMRLMERFIDRSFGISADAARELSRMLFTANPQERLAILRRLAEIMPPDRMARFNQLMEQVTRYGVAPGIAGASASQQGPVGPVNL